ncbi:hypothetical protein FOZ60_004939 [Perkinsus olseni]|uniref:Uncharacterized protein n=1 Tax=Perkinsus olseni TaxID=32597 RepID=A0A7J6NT04_PEROL|nr:hypothetical protein FOZ60_004939 [Perkinsus olseni]
MGSADDFRWTHFTEASDKLNRLVAVLFSWSPTELEQLKCAKAKAVILRIKCFARLRYGLKDDAPKAALEQFGLTVVLYGAEGQASLSGVRVIPCAFGVTLGGDDRRDRTSVARVQRIAKAPAARWANEEGMQLAPDKEEAVVCGGEAELWARCHGHKGGRTWFPSKAQQRLLT